jgi:hypothetical protein
MHGAFEVVTFFAFVGTMAGAFALRLSKPAKPVPTMFLVGSWPVLFGLLTEGKSFFDAPGLWCAGAALTLPATWLGSALAAALLRRQAKSDLSLSAFDPLQTLCCSRIWGLAGGDGQQHSCGFRYLWRATF